MKDWILRSVLQHQERNRMQCNWSHHHLNKYLNNPYVMLRLKQLEINSMRLDRFWMLLSADVLLLVLGGRRWIECWHIASIDTKKLIFDWQMVYHEVATITKTIDATRNRRIKYSNIISTDQIDFFQVLMQPRPLATVA